MNHKLKNDFYYKLKPLIPETVSWEEIDKLWGWILNNFNSKVKNTDEFISKEVSVPINFMRKILDKYLTHYTHAPYGKQFEHWERLIEHLRDDLEDYERDGIVEDVDK